MEKRGVGHIEIIFAFLIFIAAVGIALFFFRPGAGNRLIDVSLDYVDREIMDNASVVVEVYSVGIDNASIISQGGGDIEILIPNVDPTLTGTRVSDRNGGVLGSYRSGDSVFIEESVGGWGGVDFVFVSFSEEFTNIMLPGTPLPYDETFYRIASSEFKNILSERKTGELIGHYDSNYFDLKKEFNLPDRVNFGFEIDFESGTQKAEREIPVNFEVFSNNRRVEFLKADGEIVFADFTAKVW